MRADERIFRGTIACSSSRNSKRARMTKFHAATAALTTVPDQHRPQTCRTDSSHAAQEPGAAAPLPAGMTWYCPMHPEMTRGGHRPVSGLQDGAGGRQSARHPRIRARLRHVARCRHGRCAVHDQADGEGRRREAITKFEEVHDKRYHLFIISRDMSVFEHVHPVAAAGRRVGRSRRRCRSPATTTSCPTSCRPADRRRSSRAR